MKKLLLISAILVFACSTDSDGNPCIYEPTLETNEVTDITETSATLNGVISIVSENCEVALGEMQGFVYSTNPSPTNDDNVEVVYGTDISTTIDNLIPDTTYYVRVFITNSLGEFYGNEIEFTTNETCDVVYLDENGVTIKACPDANVGDVGTVNGIEYTVVDNEMLFQMRGDFGQIITADFTKLCTTRVTNMSNLFLCYEEFNQPIGNWDVSSVTDMSLMFANECEDFHNFNQDISQWDVSNVTDMQGMFSMANFNQDISQWDVSNVTKMNSMFYRSDYFNQSLNNWDVSNVTDMSYMFYITLNFNQDLSNWNVENVTNCGSFSQGASAWTLSQPNFTNCNPN